MKRSESLRRLHALAEAFRERPEHWAAHGQFDYVAHGKNAVRAIRKMEAYYLQPSGADYGYNRPFIVSESRLAFRAALRACGIQGAL